MDPMDFPRIRRLPPYVFNIVGDFKQKARRAGEDIIDFGMGNLDGATPPHVVAKLIEAASKPINHRYLVSTQRPTTTDSARRLRW
jgi:alanine-synthesizing transaminase